MSALTARFDVSFPGFRLDVSLDLPGQGVSVIFGPSGCGKTTLLRCMAGLERPPSGVMRVDDEVWQDEGVFVPIHQRGLGFVFQESRLFPHLNVRSNLEYGFHRTPQRQRTIFPDRVVDILGIGHLLGRRPHHLSGGEKQRVAIGRALLTSPRLLLMDEPLAALDAARKREILPFFLRLKRELNIPIIYVSHSLGEVLQLVDTLALLEAGKVLACGSVGEVFSHLELRGHIDKSMIGAVLDARVTGHEPEFGLTLLDFMGQALSVPRQDIPVGQTMRLHILSQDVSIVLDPPNFRTSVLNILQATVMEVGTIDGYSVDIKLDIGRPVLATITKKSFVKLGLRPGQKVYAHIKAVKMVTEGE